MPLRGRSMSVRRKESTTSTSSKVGEKRADHRHRRTDATGNDGHPTLHPFGRAQSGQKSRSSGFFAHLIPSLWRRACAFDDQSERRLRCGSNSFFIKFHRSLFPPRHSSVRPRPFTPFPNASTEREWGRQSRAPRRLSAKKVQ